MFMEDLNVPKIKQNIMRNTCMTYAWATWAMVSTWMGDHSSVEVDAVVKNTVKSRASNKNS